MKCLFLLIICGACLVQATKDPLHVHGRLPRVVKAIGYDFQVEPFFPFPGTEGERADFTFRGDIQIHFHVLKPTHYVWLNSENLEIKSVKLIRNGIKEVIESVHMDTEESQIRVAAVNWFMPGENHTLEFVYKGALSTTRGGGFFYYTYKFNNNINKTIVATVFEPAMARLMFPCFDDPHFKAWYQLKIIAPKNAAVFHTTPEWDRQEYTETKDIITFKKTPPLPSYTFSVVVGDFDYLETKTQRRQIPIRSITFTGQASYTKETMEISAKCVDGFELLTGYNYPLEKLDIIDTHDFLYGRGGLENWGLILYANVLPHLWSSLSNMNVLALQTVICHETSHQWMGDLVTIDHWGDEFLYQSFANYFSYRMIQTFTDDKDYVESDYQTQRYYGFLSTFQDNHPIVANESNFDGTVYSGGCSVIRMLEAVVAPDFYSIMSKFLNKFAYGNVELPEFIALITEYFNNDTICGDLTYDEFLRDFLIQPYYPIVTIDTNGHFNQRSANNSLLHKWNIPLFVWNDERQRPDIFWLRKDLTTCPQLPTRADPRTIFNYHGLSFAAIRYTADYWENLLQIDYGRIDEHTILGLLVDLSMDDDLETPPGQERIVSRFVKKLIADYNGLISPHVISQILTTEQGDQQLIRTLIEAAYPHVDWDANTLREGAFTDTVLPSAVKLNVSGAFDKATTYFMDFVQNCNDLKHLETCNTLNPNIRKAVYCAGAMSKDQNVRSFLENYVDSLNALYETQFYFSIELARATESLDCKPTTD